jgi:hypothetical protein
MAWPGTLITTGTRTPGCRPWGITVRRGYHRRTEAEKQMSDGENATPDPFAERSARTSPTNGLPNVAPGASHRAVGTQISAEAR